MSQKSALIAAAMATAVRSEPPLPSVVTSEFSVIPWNPATTTTFFSASAFFILSASMLFMRARVCASSVMMPDCLPVSETAGTFASWSAIAKSAMVTRSPVESSMSISRSSGVSEICCARFMSFSVSPLIADTTTTTRCPSFLALATLLATFLMRSMLPTDVPPYFWTIRLTFGLPPCKVFHKLVAFVKADLRLRRRLLVVSRRAAVAVLAGLPHRERHRVGRVALQLDRRGVVRHNEHAVSLAPLERKEHGPNDLLVEVLYGFQFMFQVAAVPRLVRRLDVDVHHVNFFERLERGLGLAGIVRIDVPGSAGHVYNPE